MNGKRDINCTLPLLLFLLLVGRANAFGTETIPSPRGSCRFSRSATKKYVGQGGSAHVENAELPDSSCESPLRRTALTTIPTLLAFSATWPVPAQAKLQTTQYANRMGQSKARTDPKKAFKNLLKAKDELVFAQGKFFKNRDFEGLRNYLKNEAEYINEYEENATSILRSGMLTEEDKKEIGTIRTYGVGADVMIMYGGLLAEIDEANEIVDAATAGKYLTRAIQSLDEVITICRNNGLA